jgi:hypothetical protein
MLAWKIGQNALVTQQNLWRRGMSMTSLCQIYGREDEDTLHVFLRCPHARDLWRAMLEIWELPNIEELRPVGRDWLMQIMHRVPLNQQARMLLIF